MSRLWLVLKRRVWASSSRSSSAPSMRETLPSCLRSPASPAFSLSELILPPPVICAAVQHSFLTVYATLWQDTITLVPYGIGMGGSSGRTRADQKSACLAFDKWRISACLKIHGIWPLQGKDQAKLIFPAVIARWGGQQFLKHLLPRHQEKWCNEPCSVQTSCPSPLPPAQQPLCQKILNKLIHRPLPCLPFNCLRALHLLTKFIQSSAFISPSSSCPVSP